MILEPLSPLIFYFYVWIMHKSWKIRGLKEPTLLLALQRARKMLPKAAILRIFLGIPGPRIWIFFEEFLWKSYQILQILYFATPNLVLEKRSLRLDVWRGPHGKPSERAGMLFSSQWLSFVVVSYRNLQRSLQIATASARYPPTSQCARRPNFIQKLCHYLIIILLIWEYFQNNCNIKFLKIFLILTLCVTSRHVMLWL